MLKNTAKAVEADEKLPVFGEKASSDENLLRWKAASRNLRVLE